MRSDTTMRRDAVRTANMPAGQGEEERFAAAVEYGPVEYGAAAGVDVDTEFAHELELVALLRSGGPALDPDPLTKARAKRRLMAAFAQEFGTQEPARADDVDADETGPLQVVTPLEAPDRPRRARAAGRHAVPEPLDDTGITVTEITAAEPPVTAGGRAKRAGRRQRGAAPRGHHRAGLLGAAAAAALVAFAGAGTMASRDALPGEELYPVKRVAESTSLALTFGERAKARRHLEQAQTRLDEVDGMVARKRAVPAAAPSDASTPAPDPQLLVTTMQEFNSAAGEGSRMLLSGTDTPDASAVGDLKAWAEEQSARLTEIRAALPAPEQADPSLRLLDEVLGKAAALETGVACDPVEATAGDGTGQPADPACVPRVGAASPGGAGDVPATPQEQGGDGPDATDDTSTGSYGDDRTRSLPDGRTDDGVASRDSSGSSDDSDRDRTRDGDSGGGSGAGDTGGSSTESGEGGLDLPLIGPVQLPLVGHAVPGLALG
jgi:hypothetical protein